MEWTKMEWNGMKHIIKDVPTTYVVKHKNYVTKLENQAGKFSRLEKLEHRRNCVSCQWESGCSVQQLP